MVLTASQCDAPHKMSLSKVNNASAYAVGLRMTMLQIYLYQYWTMAETQKKGGSDPRPCVDLIIIIYYYWEISRGFYSQRGNRPPLSFSRNRPENHSHNLGKALGKGLGLLKTGSLSLSLSLSPLYPFNLSISFTSLSFSPLYPFHLSLSLSLLSLPPSLYLSFYISFSLSPFLSLLSSILFGVSNGRFRPC